MDKENEPLSNHPKTPPLVGAKPSSTKKSTRKSSSKKVRFSTVASDPSEESPLVFPSEEDLLSVALVTDSTAVGPFPSPPPSGTHRQSFVALGNAFSAFLSGADPNNETTYRRTGLFDTPSQRQRESIAEASPQVGDTPGGRERALFGFQCSDEDPRQVDFENVVDGLNYSLVVPVSETTPQPKQAADDPALVDQQSSRKSSAKRRRRLSNFEDMESELLSSPERVVHVAMTLPKTPAKSITSFIHRCMQYFLQKPEFLDAKKLLNEVLIVPKLELVTPELAKLQSNYIQAVALTTESAARQIEEIHATCAKRINNLTETISESPQINALFHQYTELGQKEFCAKILDPVWDRAVAKSGRKLDALVTHLIESLGDSAEECDDYLQQIKEETQQQIDTIEGVESQLQRLGKYVDRKLKITESEYTEKVVNRPKSIAEVEVEKFNAMVDQHEAKCIETVRAIEEIEQQIAVYEKVRFEKSSAVRNFYLRNGWHFMKETSAAVFVYCCCHMLIFQRAQNNSNYWKYTTMVPVRLERNPAFAESHLVRDTSFDVPTDLSDLVDDSMFEFDGQLFYDLMTQVTTELCKWIRVRENLFTLKRRLNEGCKNYFTKIKVNANFQIEIVLVAENYSIDPDIVAPVMVRLLWFDSLRSGYPVNYANCSYLVSDSTEAGFPGLRLAVDQKVNEAKRVWEPESFELLRSIVDGIHKIAKSIKGGSVPAFIRE